MPDAGVTQARTEVAAASPAAPRVPSRWVSPMLRRILLVNLLPLALLLAALLYLDQYQNGMLRAEVTTLREQARIYAAALGEAAVRDDGTGTPRLAPDQARPLLRRLTEPTPNAQAKVYAPDGLLVADSRTREATGGTVVSEPLPPPVERGAFVGTIGAIYDQIFALIHRLGGTPLLDIGPPAGADWQPDVKEELRLTGADDKRVMPPYIRRTLDNRLLVTVAEPVIRNRASIGIVLLTREAREVDDSLLAVRLSILGLFTIALALTVGLSWYLSQTIARPILNLAGVAAAMREGSGRTGAMPEGLLARRDEIGVLAHAFSESVTALWARMDAIERFAADVAHEIKNPLSSIRSAIETLRRIEDIEKQRRLLAIIAEDVGRLDRLISDISDASRIDAELSRAAVERVDIPPILETLADIHESTRDDDGPHLRVIAPASLAVPAIEGRLVQVLRNLIGNAISFSPANGEITVRVTDTGRQVELIVEDQGPGIPEDRLEHIFDRFYSERPKTEQFGKHSGLGLSISRQIVEALKGRISAENRRGPDGAIQGARFVVLLPRAS